MSATELIGTVALWSGAFVGVLKLLDWLLSPKQKEMVALWSMRAWVWLDDQRLGRFIAAVRNQRAQRALSILAHALIISMVGTFLGAAYLGWGVNATLTIGNPRIYRWQAWIDVVALLASMVIVTTWAHPRATRWISAARSLPRYFGRVRACVLLVGCLGAAYVGLVSWYMPDIEPMLSGPGTFESRFEAAFGGRQRVIAIHALTAVLAAPVLAEALLLQFILFLSVYWLALVWLIMGLHWFVKVLTLRIAEHKDGPVLGLSALLVAIGAIAKTFSP